MKCFKCDKEIDRADGGLTLEGISVKVEQPDEANKGEVPGKNLIMTELTIDYNNKQLGKYSDGKGGCHVAICYECYIDGLFQVSRR